MQSLIIISMLSVIVESLVEYFGAAIPSQHKAFVAALVGVILCIAYNADLLASLGYPAGVPYVGPALTGLLIGRGSNVFNLLVERLRMLPLRVQNSTTYINTETKDNSHASV